MAAGRKKREIDNNKPKTLPSQLGNTCIKHSDPRRMADVTLPQTLVSAEVSFYSSLTPKIHTFVSNGCVESGGDVE